LIERQLKGRTHDRIASPLLTLCRQCATLALPAVNAKRLPGVEHGSPPGRPERIMPMPILAPIRIGALASLCAVALQLGLPCLAHAAGATAPEALHALQRLSFGPAPGELQRVMAMGVDAYIDEQLHPERLTLPQTLQDKLQQLPTSRMSLAARALLQREGQGATGQADEPTGAKRLALDAASARVWRATQSPRQLEEVMVDFWFNHFNVFEGKGLDKAWTGAFEDQAIRPHALGKFRDLLGATAHHPAMLFYLDNWLSAAPGVDARNRKGKASGLNENYARELMELHTLGVDGGYTQADVTELARIFTGWTLHKPGARGLETIQTFDARRHDHGDKLWLGQAVRDQGEAEGEWALDVLARHPATAHHIALKLARHFVSDQPPPALVQALALRFTQTDGDIRAVLATLFAHPAFRAAPGQKFKSPQRFVLSALRATGADAIALADVRPVQRAMQQLGMPLYGCLTPDGWPDTEAAWLNPEGLARRINLAVSMASGRWLALPAQPVAASGTSPGTATPMADTAPSAASLAATLGPGLSARTWRVVQQSATPLQVGLILGSPDFMRH